MTKTMRIVSLLMVGSALAIVPSSAMAQAAGSSTTPTATQSYSFDLPSERLSDALRAVATRAGLELYAQSEAVAGMQAPALHGTMTPQEAIARLLGGTGLTAKIANGAVLVRGRPISGDASASPQTPEILVTGTHIRGAQVAAPVTVIRRAEIEEAGQNDMGEVVRSLPMNFNGGQNPGVGFSGAVTNGNVNSASSINLRGLGADATLTLLNGHRLPQDSAFSGVDVSAIPVGAIDRLEIVADGASAIYGSDAVGGVANVMLRRDFEGLLTTARVGSSTDGGDFQNQEGLVAGHRWNGGGFMVTYDYDAATSITAGQRAYAGNMSNATTLMPSLHRHAAVLTAHQTLGENVTFSLDGLYNHRESAFRNYIITPTFSSITQYNPGLTTFSIAPEIAIRLPASWQAKVSMSYGQDNTHYDTSVITASATTRTIGCYCDQAFSAEANADGSLFKLPGGRAHVAFGGGYRSNQMDYSRIRNGSLQGAFSVNRKTYYAYGELALPLLKPAQPLPFLKSLSVSAAARYEDYPGMAHVTTPKLGLTYELDDNLTIKASWGRSFKAPTLYQQYVGYEILLEDAQTYGAGPAGKTIVDTSGGNPDLKPERARTWTAGLDLHPVAVPNFALEASYFNIHYTNRVVEPITGSLSNAFSNPGYASLLLSNPSADLINHLAANSLYGLENYASSAYDPANVLYLVDDRYLNVAQQQIEGVDLSLHYKKVLASDQTLSLSASSTYLKSNQQITKDLPATTLAGTIFNPPSWRARGGATWQARDLTLSGFVNYTGGVSDTRYTPAPTISSYTTLDLTGSYKLRLEQRSEPTLEITLAVLNLFNRRPQLIKVTNSYTYPYDTTNSSPVGRFVSLSISRKW
jgi:iron complex outermembrane recepter protein